MCGVFTAHASWSEVVDFSQPLTVKDGDELIRFRVGQPIPVVVWDAALSERVVLMMQWGFPTRNGRGLAHFHVRSETIDQTRAFAPLFTCGKRGIVAVRTFNEGPSDEKGRTIQHVIDPHEEAPLGFAVLFDKFNISAGETMACVQVTVPANQLIATLGGDVDRMPTFIEYADWGAWLGQTPATPEQLKALLRTKEGVQWTMSREQKATQAKKAKTKPTVSDPTPGLF